MSGEKTLDLDDVGEPENDLKKCVNCGKYYSKNAFTIRSYTRKYTYIQTFCFYCRRDASAKPRELIATLKD